jgi:hypothetical protein
VTAAERGAWRLFERQFRDVMPASDGLVPVAIVLVPAITDDDGRVLVNIGGGARIVFPADLPVEARAPLFARLAHELSIEPRAEP